MIIGKNQIPYVWFLELFVTWCARSRLLRLGRIVWAKGKPGLPGGGYSAQLSLALAPRLFAFKRECHDVWLTLLGVRVHYRRSYGGWICAAMFTLALVGCEPKYGWADCGHLFCHKQKIVHHAAVVQQVPYAFYAAGQSIQEDALAAKVAALVEQRLTQSLKQQQTAPKQAANVFAKCVSCHSGANSAGGLVLDGQTGVSCLTYFRWGQIAGQGKGVPAKMQAVISGLTPEEKGAINSALLDLVQPTPAKAAEPQEDLE